MKELKKIEIEETTKTNISRSEIPLIRPSLNIGEFSTFIINWSFILPISPFSPRLFADLGIPDIVKMPPDIRSSS